MLEVERDHTACKHAAYVLAKATGVRLAMTFELYVLWILQITESKIRK